ncbi:hypothetical protein GLOTRDRAFT_139931 [Gloeophyllum trabeum ATCC 11539]|uniref:Protein kinase domain-containing protein n=1 Tax=Gloeophyllum trabeum (strain ATCC 11539 / FP-39264 / Madison 617) TaxID=670483 RepID=S7Q099_GLOTA|nr:uncharacterized protein GLOTRDRAFT_139931 [Gloeophyllum trabeum ATCC 11539]EPQ52947.1 hypothetical protein GLOTRDRAFT_139931 [Gloeophyllum trabeum ATCC 11539]
MSVQANSSLAGNSLAAVIIRGLVKSENGSDMDLHLIRTPPEAQNCVQFVQSRREGVALSEMPARPSSTLPEPGNAVLIVRLKEGLGKGRAGAVHDVEICACSTPFDIPPLVVKVANRDFCDDLSKEAWLYEEMESLQGVAVPRYYGYFLAELPPHAKVASWNRIATTKFPISILLLERLGGKLPLGRPIPQNLQDDLWDVMKDISELHIFNDDIRYDNVLLAPKSPPALPSLVSPYRHRSYGLRLVDFDTAYKINFYPHILVEDHEELIRLILDNVPQGGTVNPSDRD